MIRALWTAATGMDSQQTNIDVIANNLANVNTSGFKKSRADFQELLYQVSKTPGSSTSADTVSPTGIQVGLGSRTAAVQKVFSTGDMMQTENELDLAIEGRGFFQVEMPDGTTAYTRSGALKKDGDGRLTTSEGYLLTPQIVIPENTTSISIGQDGTVDVFLDGESTSTEIGVIEMAIFSNESGLRSLGRNLFAETLSSGVANTGIPGENGLGTLSQGYLEGSNVSVMEEMVNMIAGQRAYEVNSKAIQTADEMLQMTNNLI
ncbi:flagellar basal-body rod protein FlgG [Desulfuromonas acetoxidans]|uniref:Flagellar basal-body rod protein FlgG n=1 Tax=Desulfuromonas acetoxidans (strain DSM 684 / 11070) TaxID=281689 RepID=Q1JZR4_DESA6|nr:flagellar basal-body rod protein FlgG [Desulfuromonas acetoxidans]EAT15828.1 Flagellar basal-body rod FlgG [Desulfuromonas acetoxidans DSM 684]MBF0644970.1 flagellar basal-body rod protein FlgG [Desulfuromonas acetoxidans]NVD25627.1 flagellar basal-body rod protein FlgG [Desulfuromonas acetoxidans]NVE17679.1 flagellar basal-body rod protein FlgG [Desulfuromonas acetoxidans]